MPVFTLDGISFGIYDCATLSRSRSMMLQITATEPARKFKQIINPVEAALSEARGPWAV
jgi:hypothetical protein